MFEFLGPWADVARENWMFLIGPITIFLSASIAIGLAWWNIRSNRRIATIKLFEESELSHKHQELVHSFAAVKASRGGLLILVDKEDEMTKLHKQNVFALLNHYEILAIGIKRRVLDQRIAKLYLREIFCTRWDQAKPLVEAWRTGEHGSGHYEDLCYYFEALVKKWK